MPIFIETGSLSIEISRHVKSVIFLAFKLSGEEIARRGAIASQRELHVRELSDI